MTQKFTTKSRAAGMLFGLLLVVSFLSESSASGHREAPLTAIDTKADITDWFAFVSYDNPAKVTMIMAVDPFLNPGNGPNYFPFDHEILYEMKVDNTFDADEDIKIQFRFKKPEIRLPGVFTGFIGAGSGIPAPANSPPPIPPGTPLVPPAITALDGPGSEGLSLRQTYTVKILKKIAGVWQTTFDSAALNLKMFAVPANAGPRTMPNYSGLASQGNYILSSGIRVFAGTVDDPSYSDAGSFFDSLNLRPSAFGTGVPGILSDSQDAVNNANFASDSLSGFNVNAIAIELPIAMLTSDGNLHAASDPAAVIGTYATTSRPRIKTLPTVPGGQPALSTNFVQIQRMGNASINELIIGTGDKDKFSMSLPKNDSLFASYLLDPLLARVINAAYGGAVPIPTPPRTDLLPLITYTPPISPPGSPPGPVADLLRLNTGVPATLQVSRKRMGLLAGDPAGYPNGHRVSDDVTDISLRALTGVLAGPPFNGFPNNRIGDSVNANDRFYQETFPYVAFSNDGRNSRHVDPSETGCLDPVTLLPVSCPVN
ncbi:MAG: DUF4331 domain-containing protein [Methylococcaceae bacterium]